MSMLKAVMEKSKFCFHFTETDVPRWKHLNADITEVPSGAVSWTIRYSVGSAGSDRYICECLLEHEVLNKN